MKNFKRLSCISMLILVASCASKSTVKDSDSALLQNEGYLALAFNTKDKIRTLKIYGETTDTTDLHISSIPNGISFFMFKVPVGKYCVRKFSTHNFAVTITKGGACMDVEAGKVNYPGHIIPRGGGTFIIKDLTSFLKLFKTQYPVLCKDYLLTFCEHKIISEELDNIRFAMPGISSLREEHRRREAPKAGTRIKGKNSTIDTRDVI